VTLPYTPYIVTCLGRDGSNWLGGLIRDNPVAKVRWDNELLMLYDKKQRLKNLQIDVQYASVLDANFILGDATYNPNNECDASGLKFAIHMLHRQSDGTPAVAGIMDFLRGIDPPLRVIHLERRNLLRSLVSLKVAQVTKIWWVDSGDKRDYRSPVVHLTKQEVQQTCNYRSVAYAALRRMFAGHPSLNVYYEDLRLNRDRVLREVYQFLSLPSELVPADSTVRQEHRSLREAVSNYEKLKAMFLSTEWEALFD